MLERCAAGELNVEWQNWPQHQSAYAIYPRGAPQGGDSTSARSFPDGRIRREHDAGGIRDWLREWREASAATASLNYFRLVAEAPPPFLANASGLRQLVSGVPDADVKLNMEWSGVAVPEALQPWESASDLATVDDKGGHRYFMLPVLRQSAQAFLGAQPTERIEGAGEVRIFEDLGETLLSYGFLHGAPVLQLSLLNKPYPDEAEKLREELSRAIGVSVQDLGDA